jgi:Mrp family chromosome partitioning ATPase
MTAEKWKVLGITSPTPGCGKTLTAVNLAFSIARQPDKSVVLVDMDLQKPQVAKSLGVTFAARELGVVDLLQGRAALPDVAIPVRAGNERIVILPAAATAQSSELMGSHAMSKLLQELRRDYQIVVVDLPPMLLSDDVIAIAPLLDCVLLVAAIGHSKASEVQSCIRQLQPSTLLRVVVNKATEANVQYDYY